MTLARVYHWQMGAPRKFSPQEETAIAQQYLDDKKSTVSSIAVERGVMRSTIDNILRRAGVPIRKFVLTTEQEQEVVRRFDGGETARSIAKDFDVDHTTISAAVRRCGGKLRPKGRRRVFASREAWLVHPANRLRKLLQTARGNAVAKHLIFEEALLDTFAVDPPKNCNCCGMELDYKIYPRSKMAHSRAPSFDRCDNSLGYLVSNVRVLCWRCNRLKNDATLEELRLLGAYAERHLRGDK